LPICLGLSFCSASLLMGCVVVKFVYSSFPNETEGEVGCRLYDNTALAEPLQIPRLSLKFEPNVLCALPSGPVVDLRGRADCGRCPRLPTCSEFCKSIVHNLQSRSTVRMDGSFDKSDVASQPWATSRSLSYLTAFWLVNRMLCA
jgi:hypothetical protein